mmetsp:Transcript_9453/g.20449  ORF Transcript_9453/g.20449 Transcript_9453/m.20449 type:complete len:261 (+) Transcript_9453:180-962(+)
MNVPSTIVTNLPMMSTTMTHPLLTKRFNHPPSFHRAMPHATYPWHPHQHLHRMFSTTTTSSSNSSPPHLKSIPPSSQSSSSLSSSSSLAAYSSSSRPPTHSSAPSMVFSNGGPGSTNKSNNNNSSAAAPSAHNRNVTPHTESLMSLFARPPEATPSTPLLPTFPDTNEVIGGNTGLLSSSRSSSISRKDGLPLLPDEDDNNDDSIKVSPKKKQENSISQSSQSKKISLPERIILAPKSRSATPSSRAIHRRVHKKNYGHE